MQKKSVVGQICQTLKCATDALFKAAYRWWKKGRMNNREVSYAHSRYQRNGKAPKWVLDFINHLTSTGAQTLPA